MVTSKQFKSVNLNVQIKAFVKRVEFQNTVGRQLSTVARIREKLLIENTD